MSNQIDAKMLSDWRINYGLVSRTPAEAMNWWHDHMNGKAPAGAVAALGLCINEIERLTAALQWEQSRADRQGTHGDGCADWGPAHYECAIRDRDELRRQLDEAERDARRLDWLTERLEDVQIDSADPNDHYHGDEEDVPYPVLWRRAIDAAMGLTRPAEES